MTRWPAVNARKCYFLSLPALQCRLELIFTSFFFNFFLFFGATTNSPGGEVKERPLKGQSSSKSTLRAPLPVGEDAYIAIIQIITSTVPNNKQSIKTRVALFINFPTLFFFATRLDVWIVKTAIKRNEMKDFKRFVCFFSFSLKNIKILFSHFNSLFVFLFVWKMVFIHLIC